MDRAGAIRKWVDAAARVAKDESILAPLVKSTGLSVENVRVGLARHVEHATDEEIDALVANAHSAESVHVILSASVFVAPVRAVALALAASDHVTVRSSRREPVFAEALVRAFDDARLTLAPDLAPRDVARGEIHIYGTNDTIASVRKAAQSGVIVRAHGTAMSVAVVTKNFARAAEKLAEDVTAFDQRGCLSPRAAFVVSHGDDDARAFARALFDALEARAKIVPRGALEKGELEDLAWWESTMQYAGTLHRGASCAVGALDETVYPPSGRHMLVHSIRDVGDLTRAIAGDARFVIAIGTDALAEVRAFAASQMRVTELGELQRPPLDGPVDRRA